MARLWAGTLVCLARSILPALLLILFLIYPRAMRVDKDSTARFPETVDFPIDALYTWVDASDPKWQKARQAQRNGKIAADDKQRFNNGKGPTYAEMELKVSLQLMLRHMPWVRRIYILTMRPHRPHSCLNLDPRISIIHHDTLHMPVMFNGIAIELFLHHVPGLSEHFIYMNDDFYVLNPTRPSHFFTPKGLPIVRYEGHSSIIAGYVFNWFGFGNKFSKGYQYTDRIVQPHLHRDGHMLMMQHNPQPLRVSYLNETAALPGVQPAVEKTVSQVDRTKHCFMFYAAALNIALSNGKAVALRHDPLRYWFFANMPSVRDLHTSLDLIVINAMELNSEDDHASLRTIVGLD